MEMGSCSEMRPKTLSSRDAPNPTWLGPPALDLQKPLLLLLTGSSVLQRRLERSSVLQRRIECSSRLVFLF